MITSRKAGSLMRCEKMDPKKGKNVASKRDNGRHRRIRESWSGEERMIDARMMARKWERRRGLCWALVKMPIQFPAIPGFPWNVKLKIKLVRNRDNRRKECNEGCWEKDKNYRMDCWNCKGSEQVFRWLLSSLWSHYSLVAAFGFESIPRKRYTTILRLMWVV